MNDHIPKDPSIPRIPRMENQMEERMESEGKSGVYRDASMKIPTLGPAYIGLFGSL